MHPTTLRQPTVILHMLCRLLINVDFQHMEECVPLECAREEHEGTPNVFLHKRSTLLLEENLALEEFACVETPRELRATHFSNKFKWDPTIHGVFVTSTQLIEILCPDWSIHINMIQKKTEL